MTIRRVLDSLPKLLDRILGGSATALGQRSLVLGLVALLACARAASADPVTETELQHWSHQQWSVESGLPQITVNDMCRGPLGRLWIATENGLASFDGNEFEIYRRDRIEALRSNWITRLLVDREGTLWIGTKRNLLRWTKGEFSSVELPDAGEISALALDVDGSLLVGGDALYTGSADRPFVPDRRWSGPVSRLLSVPDGVWVAAPGQQLTHLGATHVRSIALAEGLLVTALATGPGSGQDLWVGTNLGLYRLRDDELERVHVDSELREVQALAVDHQGSLWIASRERLLRMSAHGQVDSATAIGPQAFPWVISLLADAGGMWLGSQQHGLRHSWPDRNRAYGQEQGLGSDQVWTMAVHQGQLLVGHNAGVSRWQGSGLEPLFSAASLPRPMVYSLYSDSQQRLWIGTRGGLALLPPGGVLQVIEAIGQPQINGFAEQTGRIWIATSAGLYLSDGAQLSAVSLGPSTLAVRALLLDQQDRLWVGSQNGLYRQQDDEFELVDDPLLSKAFITSMRQLDDGRLLVGTYDQGLALRLSDGWQWYDSGNGLLSDSVFHLGLIEPHLWVSHPDGAYRIRLDQMGQPTLHPQPLLRDPGDHPRRSRLRCCNGAGQDKGVAHGGDYWLPSLGGVVRIPIDAPPEPAPVVELLSTDGDDQARTLRLSTIPRDLDLRYGVVDFRHADQLRYRYRLRGYDQHWVAAQTRRQAIYTNLPPGEFLFEVQAQRPFGVWGPSTTVAVTAVPVLRETWYAQLSLALLGLIAVSGVLRWRTHRLRQQKTALQTLVAERTQALALANERLQSLIGDLQTASTTDSLTGLHNRRHLRDRIEPLLAQLKPVSKQDPNRVLGLMLIDIDHFKQINDQHGHAVGDAVLVAVADVIRRISAADDLCLRWGGEEFLIIRPLTGLAALAEQADRLRQAIADCVVPPLAAGAVRASIGYVGCCEHGEAISFEQWRKALSLADYALYAAKTAGRDQVATLDVLNGEALAREANPSSEQIRRWVMQGDLGLRVHPRVSDG